MTTDKYLERPCEQRVEKLCQVLVNGGRAPDASICSFTGSIIRIEAIRVGTALPVRDPKRLTRLLTDKVDAIDPGFGIEMMRLAATLAEPSAPKQTGSSLAGEPETDISGLIDTLANRVGEERLYRFRRPRAMCPNAPCAA